MTRPFLDEHPTADSPGKMAGRQPSEENGEPAAGWASTPTDLLLKAFACLPPQDLARVSGVSKGWNLVANDRSLWRQHATHLWCSEDATGAELKAAYGRVQTATANMRAGQPTANRVLPLSQMAGVAWSPDGGRLACASYDGTISLFQADTGAEVMRIPVCRDVEGNCELLWSPNSSKLALKNRDLHVIDASTGAPLMHVDGEERWLQTCIWSPDSAKLAF